MAEAIGITANHRRKISLTLSLLDESLCGFERRCATPMIESVLYRETNRLSERQKAAILSEVAEIKASLRVLRDELSLTGRTRDAGSIIRAEAGILWADVIKLEGKYLYAYGAPSGQLVDYLEPRIREVERRLQRIAGAG